MVNSYAGLKQLASNLKWMPAVGEGEKGRVLSSFNFRAK